MLFQDELVAHALSATGQVFVQPHMLRYSDDFITRTLLKPCAGEYATLRPPVKWFSLFIGTDGWKPDKSVRKVLGLRPLWLYYWPYQASVALRPVPRMEAQKWFAENSQYNIGKGVIYAPPGRYEAEIISNDGYTLGYEAGFHDVYTPAPVEKSFSFRLRVLIRPGTLKLKCGELTATDDGQGAITGADWIEAGTVDYQTCEVQLRIRDDVTLMDAVEANFWAVNPGVEELEWGETYFLRLFASKFLPAYATARSIVRIEGLPVDIQLDGLLEYARNVEREFLEKRETYTAWWRW
jgi:hypothetical protein